MEGLKPCAASGGERIELAALRRIAAEDAEGFSRLYIGEGEERGKRNDVGRGMRAGEQESVFILHKKNHLEEIITRKGEKTMSKEVEQIIKEFSALPESKEKYILLGQLKSMVEAEQLAKGEKA